MKSLRSKIIKYSKMLNSKKLSALRSGNISARFKDGFLITPSGKKYSSLKNKDIVFVSLDGKFDKKKGIPSSEWKFHQDIYLNKKEAKAIVHAHSTNATAVSSHSKKHSFFSLHGCYGWRARTLNVQNMQPYGTRELSKNILKALKGRKACLIGNHGQIAFEENLPKAFELAEEVENISLQYITSLKLGKPKILSLKEMKKVLLKAKNYKKG
jgi:L-fuculose-phosphate aldolase